MKSVSCILLGILLTTSQCRAAQEDEGDLVIPLKYGIGGGTALVGLATMGKEVLSNSLPPTAPYLQEALAAFLKMKMVGYAAAGIGVIEVASSAAGRLHQALRTPVRYSLMGCATVYLVHQALQSRA